MHMFENIPGCAQDILVTSENVVRSLTCNNLELSALDPVPSMAPSLAPLSSPPLEIPVTQVQGEDSDGQEFDPKRAPWLLVGMILMGLDSYFPCLSAVSSLCTPLQAAISVMNDISPGISGKLQLGELNSGPDYEGCGDPAGPWAARLCFSRLASGSAETGIGLNLINQGILQARLAANLQKQAGLLEELNQYGPESKGNLDN
ncbi:hypothetical protein DSO57_1010085 [Entomophthora muscae]|uniref:Uncharacterized protein n=1 Tax=Entomophthora muscae TaxID=34485 RepID=A0ACC2T6P2_9FUNG|nr:hypothetical protein DSO57_1010085 [Entomophthora muscae]